jgi:hypothetical protein
MTTTGDDKDEDITMIQKQQKQPKDSNNNNAVAVSNNSYSVFNAVDAAVAKPVMGSDGAAQWQEFRAANVVVGRSSSSSLLSTAPTAPLKRADRAMGFTSWQDERAVEVTTRQETGDRAMHGGYQHFHRKNKNREMDKQDSVPERHDGELPRPAATTATATTTTDGDNKDADNNDTSRSSSKKTKKKRKKEESAAAAPVMVRDPTHPLEQVAAAVQRQKMMKQQQPDGAGWETAIDPTSQRPYYFHRPTGQRTWDRPLSMAGATTVVATTTTSTTTNDNGSTWKETKDASTGKTYYYNTKTNVTTWERPPDFLPPPS